MHKSLLLTGKVGWKTVETTTQGTKDKKITRADKATGSKIQVRTKSAVTRMTYSHSSQTETITTKTIKIQISMTKSIGDYLLPSTLPTITLARTTIAMLMFRVLPMLITVTTTAITIITQVTTAGLLSIVTRLIKTIRRMNLTVR